MSLSIGFVYQPSDNFIFDGFVPPDSFSACNLFSTFVTVSWIRRHYSIDYLFHTAVTASCVYACLSINNNNNDGISNLNLLTLQCRLIFRFKRLQTILNMHNCKSGFYKLLVCLVRLLGNVHILKTRNTSLNCTTQSKLKHAAWFSDTYDRHRFHKVLVENFGRFYNWISSSFHWLLEFYSKNVSCFLVHMTNTSYGHLRNKWDNHALAHRSASCLL